MYATLINPRTDITDVTLPVGTKVVCKKATDQVLPFTLIRVYDQQGNELGGLTQHASIRKNGPNLLLPNTECVTAEMRHKLPECWEGTIVGHGQVDIGCIRQAAVVEF